MLKLTGVILAALAMPGLVISVELELLNRQKQLRSLSVFLTFLHNQICVLCVLLPLVIDAAIRQVGSPYQEVCRSFVTKLEQKSGEEVRILWQDACRDQKQKFVLRGEEWMTFLEIGDALSDGTIGFREQVFSLLEKRVICLQNEFSDSLAEKRKITRFGIVASGLFLIVLLI